MNMDVFLDAWPAVRDFMETGGWVLNAIALVTFAMWTLIIERYWYFATTHKSLVESTLARWYARDDRTSWHAHKIRAAMISDVSLEALRGIPVVKALVALCPLFGLLGTVTGMIEVFDAMSIAGSGNARAMASGVSRATIPTMAGMVASLSGLIFSVQLERRAATEAELIAEHLSPDGRPRAEKSAGRRETVGGGFVPVLVEGAAS
ncbi:MAG: biopolymer transport protein ExbB [Hyphomicrobiaceae bacterium]